MIYDFNSDSAQISIQKHGGKFFYLYHLNKLHSLKVPDAICITALNYDQLKLQKWLDASKTYAVRSSANQEDLKGRSAAGVFDSFLNVSGIDAVQQAIERCFHSINSEKVKVYLNKIGISENQLHMHVIVQEMIQAEKSGVLFTMNPVSGKDEIYIQMVDGIGDKLVSGQVNPSTEIISKSEPPSGKLQKELWQTANLIEKELHAQQDIEWAWDGNQLFVLQTRPLDLRPKKYPPEQVWTRANIGEIIPKPLTPLSWDVFRDVIFNAYRIHYYSLMDRFFTNIIHILPRVAPVLPSPKMFSGHLYLNLDTIFRSFGLEAWVTKEVMQAGLGFSIPDQTRSVRINIWDKVYTWIKKIIFRLEQIFQFISMEERLKKFIDKHLQQMSEEAESDSIDNILKKVRFLFGWHMAITARSFSHLGFLFQKAQKVRNQAAIFSSLVNSLSQEETNSYMRDFESLSKEQFLNKYGHRSINEFELLQPAWKDQPELFETFLNKNLLHNQEMNQATQEERRIPDSKRKRFQTSIRLREKLKSELIRHYRDIQAYYLNQARLLKSEGLLERAEDIFFLKKDEISDLMQNKSKFTESIKQRTEIYNEQLQQNLPNNFYGTDLPKSFDQDILGTEDYQGIGCSEGIVSGTVFIVSSYEETANINANSIVITKSADPGWTPVLLQCKGMVAEVGGILSHIATIARENNVPMIVGIENITKHLKTGQQITIDGGSGKLTLHPEERAN